MNRSFGSRYSMDVLIQSNPRDIPILVWCMLAPTAFRVNSSGDTIPLCMGSTTTRRRTFRLRHFVYRHFVYRHFVYYCIPACMTVIHPTSVSANHYFHQFQLLLTL